MRKPIPISELLALNKSKLKSLQAGMESANRVLAAVQQLLPSELVPHVFGASIDERGVLTLLVDSGAFATRVRYALPALVSAIEAAAQKGKISRTQVRVRPKA
ncbi:MAG: DciA family protein [Pseudomonadota bacterium]